MNLKDAIRTIPDFPKPGIMYRDITTLLTNRRALTEAIVQLSAPYKTKDVDNVAGIEARGFTFGTAVAYELGAGFVPYVKKASCPLIHMNKTMSLNMEQTRSKSMQIVFAKARMS